MKSGKWAGFLLWGSCCLPTWAAGAWYTVEIEALRVMCRERGP